LGGKWQKKNKCHGKGNRMSCFGFPSSLRLRGRVFVGYLFGTA
jgi:hypothetical protein